MATSKQWRKRIEPLTTVEALATFVRVMLEEMESLEERLEIASANVRYYQGQSEYWYRKYVTTLGNYMC